MMKAVVKELRAEKSRLSKELKKVEAMLGRAVGGVVKRRRKVKGAAEKAAPVKKGRGKKSAAAEGGDDELAAKRARLKALKASGEA